MSLATTSRFAFPRTAWHRRQSRRSGPGLLAVALLVLILCYPVVVVDAQQTDEPTTTNGATGARKTVKGEIYIELKNVVDLMPDDVQAAYEEVCNTFFGEAFAQWSPWIDQVKTTLLEQTNVSPQSAGADEDENEDENGDENENEYEENAAGGDEEESLPPLGPLLTLVQVEGEVLEEADVTEVNFYLLVALLADKKGFIDELTAASLFFLHVKDLEAYDPDLYIPETTSSTERGEISVLDDGDDDDDDDDLAAVGIVLALIGGCVILVAIIGVGRSLTKRHVREIDLAEERVGEIDVTKERGVGETPAPVARAAEATPKRTPVGPPIKASAVAEESIEFDILPAGLIPPPTPMDTSTSEQTGGLSFTYSLEAGTMEQQTYPIDISDTGAVSTLGGDQEATEFSGRAPPNMVSREVVVPPGKLGIVIDATLEGPVVHTVNPGSPLAGVVQPGDIIVEINGVDTRAMSESAITALMARTNNLERRMIVLSPDETGSASTKLV